MRNLIALSAFAIAIASTTAAHATPISIRAYVDAGYGKTDKLKQVVADASTILSAQTGTTLELVEVKPWTPSPAAAKNLRAALAELPSADPGKDAVAVGFIGSQAQAGVDYHKLTNAKILGRYAVVRAVSDAHEEAVLIVHAIAHVLGSAHVGEGASIMEAAYDKADKTIDADDVALIQIGTAFATAKNDVDRASAAAQLKREVTARKAKLDDKSAADVLSAIDELAGSASSEVTLSKDQAAVFNDAVAAMNKKDYAGAFKKIQPLADKPDAAGSILAVACRIDSYDGITDPNAAAHCDRALKAAPNDVGAAVAAVRYALHTGDAARTKAAFAEAARRVSALKAGTGGADVDELASLALGTNRLALAEQALAKSASPSVKESEHAIEVARMRAGLPRGLLSADDEAAVEEVVRDAGTKKEIIDAMTEIDNAMKQYGNNVPALLAERCDLQRKKQKLRDAEESCRLAVEKYPDGSGPLMLLGMVYSEDDLQAKAQPLLEKSIALDPDFEQTYYLLDDVYHRLGKREERKKLQAQYQQHFKKDLSASR